MVKLQNTERAKEEIKRVLEILNNHLATRTFLVGERISLADISVACNLLQLYQYVSTVFVVASLKPTLQCFISRCWVLQH